MYMDITCMRNKGYNCVLKGLVFVAKLEFTRNGRQFVWKKQITMLDRGSSALKANLELQSNFNLKGLQAQWLPLPKGLKIKCK